MQEIEETKMIVGGAKSISAAIVNAAISAVRLLYSVGQGLGGALRRSVTGTTCKVTKNY